MVALKLVYADDIRKIHIECLSISTLYETIKTLFSELESIPFDNLYVYYVDDENDKIRIKFDNELCEALRYTNEKNVLLKIFVQKQVVPAAKTELNDIANLDPLLGWMNGMAPMLLNNPATMQHMASMLPAMMPLINSMLGTFSAPLNASQIRPTTSSSASPPSTVDGGNDAREVGRIDSSVGTEYNCASTSTNTHVDAKDVSTETFKGVAQTTQTQQQNANAHQMTQTNQNSSSATQTAQGVSATQTTQTQQNESCATQTTNVAQPQQHGSTQTHQNGETQTTRAAQVQQHGATQTAQTHESIETQTAQVQSASKPIETQTTDGKPGDFYASLAQTKFGGLLEQLNELGFTDKEKCVQALVKNGGRLPEAIDELLLDSLLA